MKTCTKCGVEKELGEFYKRKGVRDGRQSHCKDCDNYRNRKYYSETFRWAEPEYRKKKREENPEAHRLYSRRYSLKRNYGITVEHYNNMFLEQKGKCKLCRIEQTGTKRLAVDHCHATNKVRGLLCDKCNRAIGLLQDSPGLLRKAADYVEHHQEDWM